MKITNKDILTIIEAEEGMILVGQDGYGSKILYLGIYDSPDNYTEIPEDEYVEPNEDEEIVDILSAILSEEVNK